MSRLAVYESEGTVEDLIYQLNAVHAGGLVLTILPQQEVTRLYKDKYYVVDVSQAILRFDDYPKYEYFAPKLGLPILTAKEYFQ